MYAVCGGIFLPVAFKVIDNRGCMGSWVIERMDAENGGVPGTGRRQFVGRWPLPLRLGVST